MTDVFLKSLPAFRALPGPVLAGIAGKMRLRRYRKGEAVFAEGDAPDAVHLLKTGLVKTVKRSASPPAALEIIAPGGFFGMIAAMDGKPYPVSAVALGACDAYRIPAKDFAALADAQPRFSRHVYAWLGGHLRRAQALRALSSEPVPRRIAHVLGVLVESMGNVLTIRREDVAEIAGCTNETAIRALADFRKSGLIATGWKRVTILDPKRLEALAAGR